MESGISGLKEQGYCVARLDGKANSTIGDFLENIGTAFNFPDYYGRNLDALEECLNDLSWIEETKYALVIDHSEDLLSREPKAKLNTLLEILEEVAQNWGQLPVYNGSPKPDFKIILR